MDPGMTDDGDPAIKQELPKLGIQIVRIKVCAGRKVAEHDRAQFRFMKQM